MNYKDMPLPAKSYQDMPLPERLRYQSENLFSNWSGKSSDLVLAADTIEKLPAEVERLKERLAQAEQLLARCEAGFGAYVMGRRLARRERDKLRGDIQDYIGATR